MAADGSRARALIGPYALLWFYRRWLRVHAVQELLAGLGVAIAVALVFATIVAAGSIAGSAGEAVHAVIGPANLQLHARAPTGIPQRLLQRVEALPGVEHAAPLLEQSATVLGPRGGHATVDLAGADASLVLLDGLGHTLPRATLTAGGVGLSAETAREIGLPAAGAGAPGQRVTLTLGGHSLRERVSAVLGDETFGALAQARVAVMPLEDLQRIAGMQGRVSRVLVQTRPGQANGVRAELARLAGGRIDVAAADQDIVLLEQALRPSNQASELFAALSALLGVLLATGALLLAAPERRRAIADLRLMGAKRSAIVQMFLFQAVVLGAIASLVGLLVGYGLSLGFFAQSPSYLAEAFTLGTRTVIGTAPLLIALIGGIAITCLASMAPLLDLRRTGALDRVYRDDGVPGNALAPRAQRSFGIAAAALLIAASILFASAPPLALVACTLLALATVLAVPLTLGAGLRAAGALAERRQTLTALPVALSSLRATTLRSLALAATGAVALFGSVALGGARSDLLHGIEGFARSYSADAAIWVSSPGDAQAVVPFAADGLAPRLRLIPGVAGVRAFQGGFMQLDGRRVWIIARPPGGAAHVLASQTVAGSASLASRRLAEGGWVALSRQLAEALHVGIGGRIRLPTPSGEASFRVVALTSNLAWSPGAVFIGDADYSRLWRSGEPTALALALAPSAQPALVRASAQRVLGDGSGLRASTAAQRQARIDSLTGEGLSQLQEISTLLLIAAILAMAAALTSAVWQRRAALAGLRLSGAQPRRLRKILLVESALMLGTGCATGALAGVYGEVVIDGYLARVTGFPVASLATGLRPLAIFALVTAVVLAIAATPMLAASRVSPRLAFDE
jgi:putative ABC transport system permease protein